MSPKAEGGSTRAELTAWSAVLWMELQSRESELGVVQFSLYTALTSDSRRSPALPEYLLWPAVVGLIFCALDFLACIASFIAIRSQEGYHAKNGQKATRELRRKHVIRKALAAVASQQRAHGRVASQRDGD